MGENRWCDFQVLEEEVTRQFHGGPHSVHGPSHWRRVEQHGIWLSKRSGADVFVVRLFAWLHDARRVNDFHDPEHGKRGAEYAASLRGKLFELEEAAFQTLVFACTWHTDRHFTDDVTAGTCWDSDRLDLGRVGIIPLEKFMNTEFAREVARAGSFYSFIKEAETP